MSGFYQDLSVDPSGDNTQNGTGTLPGPVVLRDYQHASKTFRSNFYQNAPKFKFLFHTFFNINVPITPITDNQPSQQGILYGYNSQLGASSLQTPDYGLMVKEIKLPTFSFQTVQLNQYNRKRIIQTKIKYDAIEISFHDDNLNQINQLWQTYYNYYYNDGMIPSTSTPGGTSNSAVNTNARTAYSPSETFAQQSMWGFSGGQDDAASGKRQPFFNSITVFGLSQHRYTAYTFVNPIITSFSHDTYNYAEGGGTMSNRMTIDYETVTYNYGSLDGQSPGEIVKGFGDPSNYDTTTSPIMATDGNKYALGQGGLVDASGGFVNSPNDFSDQVAATQAQNAAYNGFNTTGDNSYGGALNALYAQAENNAPTNRNTPFYIPNAQASPGPIGLANTPVIGALSSPPSVNLDGVTTDPTGNIYDAMAISTGIGIGQDPTLNQQIITNPFAPNVITYSDPTYEAQAATYASSDGISISPAPMDLATGPYAYQSTLGQDVAVNQQSLINQYNELPGQQYIGSITDDTGDLPQAPDLGDNDLLPPTTLV